MNKVEFLISSINHFSKVSRRYRKKMEDLDKRTLEKFELYQKSKNFQCDLEKERIREYLKTLNIYIHPEEDLYNNILSFKVFKACSKQVEDIPLTNWYSLFIKIFNDLQIEYDIQRRTEN